MSLWHCCSAELAVCAGMAVGVAEWFFSFSSGMHAVFRAFNLIQSKETLDKCGFSI